MSKANTCFRPQHGGSLVEGLPNVLGMLGENLGHRTLKSSELSALYRAIGKRDCDCHRYRGRFYKLRRSSQNHFPWVLFCPTFLSVKILRFCLV